MRPIHDRVIIEKTEAKTETNTGIILSKPKYETFPTGKVVGVGFDVTALKVGDHVMYENQHGTHIKENSVLLKEENVVAIIDDET